MKYKKRCLIVPTQYEPRVVASAPVHIRPQRGALLGTDLTFEGCLVELILGASCLPRPSYSRPHDQFVALHHAPLARNHTSPFLPPTQTFQPVVEVHVVLPGLKDPPSLNKPSEDQEKRRLKNT